VTGDSTPTRLKPMTLALASVAVLAAATALLPQTFRPWNVSPIGALALFAAARLGFWQGVGFVALALGLKDLGVYLHYNFEPHFPTWVCFAVYVALGWLLLTKTENPAIIAAGTVGAGMLFFLATNFVSWLEQALPYGYSLTGLGNCYEAALPFYRNTLTGDMLFAAALFGAHAVLSRAYFPTERVSNAGQAQ